MGRLDGKVALISGSARGMGESHARAFVAEGARVVVSDVLDDRGAALATELGDAAVYQHLDVTDENEWAAAVDRAETHFGRLDILVNNAGIMIVGSVENTTRDTFTTLFAVNQLGPFLGMKAAIPALKRAGGGSIVNISSESGLVGKGGLFAYSTTKWAVRGMTKSAARDLGRYGIRVNSVHPGGILTDFVLSDEVKDVDPATIYGAQPIPRIGRKREVTPLVVYLASDESSYATASEFVVDGGMTSGNDIDR
ncbi:SDR family oxidoreductase [uncultured Jatrophihabitans sp.]|uniref:SDR family oxidoreductase n=1 Tax=uncultured Jatrophihabitans sp. TaxID=1610747 RepID=UPI0035C96C5C